VQVTQSPIAGAFLGTRQQSDSAALIAEDIVKEFPSRGRRPKIHAVRHVSLQLHHGQVLALVGESGCGKSTVARLLAGLYPLTSGSIRVAGKLVLRHGRRGRDYASRVQIVLQDPFSSLNSSYSIRHHLSRPLILHHPKLSREQVQQRAIELLEEVSLSPGSDFIDRFPHELSGGQRQRVAIARALAVQPDVLMADEPVSMLDVSIRLGVLRLLSTVARERHLALLYITHDIASARYFAAETAVMYAGELVESGPSESVTQTPKHPYTQLLISAIPDPDRVTRDVPAVNERGEPPSLARPSVGCSFAPRCPNVMDKCRKSPVPAFAVGDNHWAKCFLYDTETLDRV
jgi:peptide/nickel transport system ATP-binding protein